LILFEAARSRRKENARREDVSDRLIELEENERNARRALVALEKEVLRLRAEKGILSKPKRILPKEVWEVVEEDKEQERKASSWWSWIPSFGKSSSNSEDVGDQPPSNAARDDRRDSDVSSNASTLVPHDEVLAERIAHSYAAMKKDATPPAHSLQGETEAIIDSTS